MKKVLKQAASQVKVISFWVAIIGLGFFSLYCLSQEWQMGFRAAWQWPVSESAFLFIAIGLGMTRFERSRRLGFAILAIGPALLAITFISIWQDGGWLTRTMGLIYATGAITLSTIAAFKPYQFFE